MSGKQEGNGWIGLFIFLVAGALYMAILQPQALVPTGVILLVVLLVTIWWRVAKKRADKAKKADEQRRMKQEEERLAFVEQGREIERKKEYDKKNQRREKSGQFITKLAGTRAVKARQGYLRKIDEMIAPFDVPSYGIKQTSYQGEPAFAVYADTGVSDTVIGMIPADKVNEVLTFYERIWEVEVFVYGGPEPGWEEKYYGAEVWLTYDKE